MAEEIQTNAADPQQVKSAEKKAKRLRDEELEDVRFLLKSEQGKRFMWRYLKKCKIFHSIWHASALIHFEEGRRQVGLEILSDITEASPPALVEMMTNKEKYS
jgi:hypothetical protein